jgi:hypothetical protein
MLTSILRTLGKDKNLKGAIPELTNVSLCGSGIKFYSEDSYPLGSFLVLRLILRPFIPIQAVGKIVRVDAKTKGKEHGFEIAVEFTKISSDDREAIIRHTLRSQATMQRLRLKESVDSVLD